MKNLCVLLLMLIPVGVYGSDYYVAPAGCDIPYPTCGTQTNPWGSISYAATQVASIPGATVHVDSGTYTENVETSNVTGTSGAPITFISDTQYAAKIVSSGGSRQTIWYAAHSKYLRVLGFDVKAPATPNAARLGIRFVNCPYGQVLGNRVHDIAAHNSGSDGGAGIEVDSVDDYDFSDYFVVDSNFVYNIGDSTNYSRSFVHGIYISSSQYGIVQNNLVVNAAQYGIQLAHSYNGHASSYNTVVNNTLIGSAGGVVVWADPGETVEYNVIFNNIAQDNDYHNSDAYAFREGADPGGTADYNTFDYNDMYNNSYNCAKVGSNSTCGSHNLNADASFVNGDDRPDGNYRLSNSSQCIDTGTDQIVIGLIDHNAPGKDFYGGTRPSGSYLPFKYDLGLFEYAAVDSNWPWF